MDNLACKGNKMKLRAIELRMFGRAISAGKQLILIGIYLMAISFFHHFFILLLSLFHD